MWDESKQERLQQLRGAEEERTLSEEEQAELATLIQERCDYEEVAIVEATGRAEAANVRLEAQIQQVRAQSRELEGLIQEQEAYLAEVEAIVARMEERRRNWRERYRKVTGRTLEEPVSSPNAG